MMNNDFVSMNNVDPPRKIAALDIKWPTPRPRVQSIKNDYKLIKETKWHIYL